MRKLLTASACLLALAGCTQAQVTTALQTPTGQLFCAFQTAGGPMVVALVDAAASAAQPGAAPVAIIATGTTKAVVDADCAAAGPGGVAVSPPSTPVPTVAIVTPTVAVAAPK